MIRQPRQSVRNGFSLIELLIVIAIIGVLIGLLLPAVQKVRESAARLKCSSQLRQVSLASHSAHDTIGTLQPGIGLYPNGGSAYGTYFFHLLPYLEQNSLYQQSYYSGYYFAGNNKVYSQPVSMFVCPVDPSIPSSRTVTDTNTNVWGASSYAINAQVVCDVNDNSLIVGPAFYAQIPERFPDGTSNTILLTEKYGQCFNSSYPIGGNLWAYYITGLDVQAYHGGFAISWNGYSVGPTSKFQDRPNPYNGACDPTMASSPHFGGIQIAMADASVRFLSSNVTIYTWWYLCTPNGGEVIPPDGY